MTDIHVTTAMPLTPRTQSALENWLKARYGEYTVRYHLDASIVGGVVIFDGEQVFDGSIKSKLKGLRQ